MKIIFLAVLCITLLIIILYLSLHKQTDDSAQMIDQPIIDYAVPSDSRQPLSNTTNASEGQKLFKQNCARCHTIGKGKITGPDLKDIISRVPNEEWLYHYILNNDSMYRSKDPYTMKLRYEYPKDRMDVFTGVLSEKEIKNIIGFMKEPPVDRMIVMP